MTSRVLLPALASALAWAAVAGCDDGQQPLEVERVDGPAQVMTGDSARLQAIVPGTGPFRYSWQCTRGRFDWADRNWVIWRAPDTSGSSSVWVTVIDTADQVAAETVRITVKARARRLREEDGAVKPWAYAAWADTMRAGEILTANTTGDTGLSFMLVDSANYLQWRSGQAYEYLVRRQAYQVRAYSDTVPRSGRYYAVMDNTASPVALGFHFSLDLQAP